MPNGVSSARKVQLVEALSLEGLGSALIANSLLWLNLVEACGKPCPSNGAVLPLPNFY